MRSRGAWKGGEDQLGELVGQVDQCRAETTAAQSEVDRLLELLKDTEQDKLEKEAIIKDLQEYGFQLCLP